MRFDPQRTSRMMILFASTLVAVRLFFLVNGEPAPEHIFWDALILLFGAGLIVIGFVLLHRKGQIENVPRALIRSVAMGYAEIAGQVRPRNLLIAPYSGVPCVYYRYAIDKGTAAGGEKGSWLKNVQGESCEPFFLLDESGAILVDPAGSQVVLHQSFETVKWEEELGESRCYTEWRIDPGQRLFVAGTVRRREEMAADQLAALNSRLRGLKHDAQKMMSFDADRDGQISGEEWDRAVRSVRDEVLREGVEDCLVIGKGSQEETFVISDGDEESTLEWLSKEAGLALVAGTLIVAIFAPVLLSRLGVLGSGWTIGR